MQKRLSSEQSGTLAGSETKPRILVLEDEWLIQFDVALELEQASFMVECASTNEEALGLLKSRTFDAAVIDGWLGSGWSVPVSRELERLGIPYVLCSGHPKALLAWAHPQVLVQKPVNPKRLVTAISVLTENGTAEVDHSAGRLRS